MWVKLGVTTNDGMITINVPTEPADITFSQYIDFRVKESKYLDPDKPVGTDIDRVVECVSQIVDGDLFRLPFNIDGENIQDKWNADNLGSIFQAVSLVRLYHHLEKLFAWNPGEILSDKDFTFEYMGEMFTITPKRAQRVISEGMVGAEGKTFTVMEVMEVTEAQRWLDKKADKEGDPTGAIEFERDLRKVAILARKPGEDLPNNPRERAEWIQTRAKHFSKLPMTIAIGINCFLKATWDTLKGALVTGYFSSESHH